MYRRRVFERYFTHAEERCLLQTVARYADVFARRDHAWMRLLRHSGLRVGSLASLRVCDAREALREHRLRPPVVKGGGVYEVPVSRKARTALMDLLRIRRELGLAELPEAPLIVSRNHRALSLRSFQARMQQWVRCAGLRGGSPHWFRHTLAKRVMHQSTARDPRALVQGVLNHASVNSTAVYTLPDKEDVALALEEAG